MQIGTTKCSPIQMQCRKLFLNKFAQTPLPGRLENSHTETLTPPLPYKLFVLATWWTGVRAHSGHIGSEFKVSKRLFIETGFHPQSSPIWGCG